MSVLLKINDLWGGYTEGVDILRGISMEVQQGEVVSIIGLNGSGKSTFGKAIMNMIPIRRGEILFDGEDITALSTSQLAHRGVSIMQQGGKVFRNLSVWDNLQLAMANNHSSLFTLHSSLGEVVPLLQQPRHELRHLMADKLSGGQRHQLSLAITLASFPRLVILDEPSAGLSPKALEKVYQMLHDVRAKLNITIIIIEQNIVKAVEFSDKSLLMVQGQVEHRFGNKTIKEIEKIMFNEKDKES